MRAPPRSSTRIPLLEAVRDTDLNARASAAAPYLTGGRLCQAPAGNTLAAADLAKRGDQRYPQCGCKTVYGAGYLFAAPVRWE